MSVVDIWVKNIYLALPRKILYKLQGSIIQIIFPKAKKAWGLLHESSVSDRPSNKCFMLL